MSDSSELLPAPVGDGPMCCPVGPQGSTGPSGPASFTGRMTGWFYSPADVAAATPPGVVVAGIDQLMAYPITRTAPPYFIPLNPKPEQTDTDALAELEFALAALSDTWDRPGPSHAQKAHALVAKLDERSQLAAAAYLRAIKHLNYILGTGHPEFLALFGELARFELRVLSLGLP